VTRGAGAATAIKSSTNITCPPPPPGLLGDDVLAYADGSKPRACFQLQDVTAGLAMTQRASTFSTTNNLTQYPAAGTTNFAPAAGSLLITFVTSTTTSDPTSVIGHGVNYTKIPLSANLIPAAASTHAVSVWVATAPASPTNAAAVATFQATRSAQRLSSMK
jgi:hypothetical protein